MYQCIKCKNFYETPVERQREPKVKVDPISNEVYINAHITIGCPYCIGDQE